MDATIIKSKSYKQSKINYDLYIGEISLDAIIFHTKRRLLSFDFNKDFNSLIDIRGAIITNFINDIDRFCNFMKECLKNQNIQKKCAIVTSTPVEIVHAEHFANELINRSISLECGHFSSVEAAISWLSV